MPITPGAPAANFERADLDGAHQSLDALLTEGTVALVFFQRGCGVCRVAAPYFSRLADAYSGPGWRIIGVSQDDEENTRQFVETHGWRFPVVLDGPEWPLSIAYQMEATPTLYHVTPEGIVAQALPGLHKQRLNDYAAMVAGLTGKAPIEIAPADDGAPAIKPG